MRAEKEFRESIKQLRKLELGEPVDNNFLETLLGDMYKGSVDCMKPNSGKA